PADRRHQRTAGAAELPEGDLTRRGDDQLPAVDRCQRAAAQRVLHEDPDVHAVHDGAVATSPRGPRRRRAAAPSRYLNCAESGPYTFIERMPRAPKLRSVTR